MQEDDYRAMLRALVDGEYSDEVLLAYIRLAEAKILRLVYPYDNSKTEVPTQYQTMVVEAAVYMLNKRGGEGQTQHSENGVSIHFESGDLPKSLVKQIVPFVG